MINTYIKIFLCIIFELMYALSVGFGDYRILSTIHGHISSVRCLALSRDDSSADKQSIMMFSAGGRAHLKAWRLSYQWEEDGEDSGEEMGNNVNQLATTSSASTLSSTSSASCQSHYLATHMLHGKGRKHSKPWKKAAYNPDPETRYMQLSAVPVTIGRGREGDAETDSDSEGDKEEGVRGGEHLVAAAGSDATVR